MKPALIVGILLVVIGVISLGYGAITYTTKEKVVDLGPIQINKTEKKSIPLPPILGGIALAGGIVLIIGASKGS